MEPRAAAITAILGFGPFPCDPDRDRLLIHQRGIPVISPAVVNAVAKLTGKLYRTLPLTTI
jgi:hypothetical protein